MGISESNAIKLLYNGGYKIYSCLDTSVQAKVDAVYTDLSALPKANSNRTGQQLESAIVVMFVGVTPRPAKVGDTTSILFSCSSSTLSDRRK